MCGQDRFDCRKLKVQTCAASVTHTLQLSKRWKNILQSQNHNVVVKVTGINFIQITPSNTSVTFQPTKISEIIVWKKDAIYIPLFLHPWTLLFVSRAHDQWNSYVFSCTDFIWTKNLPAQKLVFVRLRNLLSLRSFLVKWLWSEAHRAQAGPLVGANDAGKMR